MATLADHQFELDGYGFGLFRDVEVEAGGFGPSGISVNAADQTYDGATMFGRDETEPGSWSFSMFTNKLNEADALAAAGAMKRVWRARSVASTPGAFQTLRYALGGRTRRVYGRSRRWTPTPSNDILTGRLDITADFKLADDRTFSDDQGFVTSQISPAVTGGFDVPFEVPLVTEAASSTARPGQFTVGGDTATPIIVTFFGPSESPKMTIGTLVVHLPGVLIQAGQSLIVDARPWVRSARRSDGAPVGTLSRSSRLVGLELEPGNHEAVYAALDTTGTSYATVSWRDAYESL